MTASEDTKSITLSTTKKHWKEAFNHFNIEYGYSQEHHELRRHQFQRRQAPATPGATTSTAATSSTSAFLSHSTLIPANSSQATATSVALSLFHEEANTTFSMPPGVQLTAPINLGCRHCKTTGHLNLTQGEWEFDWPDMDEITQIDSVADILKAGYVQMSLSNFSAYIELSATPAQSGALVLPLFTAPAVGFRVSLLGLMMFESKELTSCLQIPELGTAGVMFEPALTFNWALTGGMRISYGFNLEVSWRKRWLR